MRTNLDLKALRGRKFRNEWGQVFNLRAAAESFGWTQEDVDTLATLAPGGYGYFVDRRWSQRALMVSRAK